MTLQKGTAVIFNDKIILGILTAMTGCNRQCCSLFSTCPLKGGTTAVYVANSPDVNVSVSRIFIMLWQDMPVLHYPLLVIGIMLFAR